MTGRRIPIKNFGGHGASDGTPHPFGLEPDVYRDGFNAPAIANLPGWCAAKEQTRLAAWMLWGNEGSPIAADMWRRGRVAGLEICDMFSLENWIGNLNSDANCEPILYLPPLPRADGMDVSAWLMRCNLEALGGIYHAARAGRKFSVCFDTLGAAGKPDDTNRHYLYALIESLTRQGISVGIEPPGEHQTLWHDFPNLFGWVTPWYLLGDENKPGGWSDIRWSPVRGRTIYVNMTPEYEQHAARWMDLGYHILTPVHTTHWNAALPEVPE
jgi:hypothetical protein